MVKKYFLALYYKKMDEQDLKHRDWLLYSTKRLLQQTGGESISIQIVDLPNDRKVLVASGITESMIDNLQFLVNTDENNNYLYLEDFKVYVDGYFAPLDLSGLRDAVVNAYRACDIDNFLLGNKTHKPFSGANFSSGTVTYNNFNEYVDTYTNINPYMPNTLGLQKTYQVTMNPDSPFDSFTNNGIIGGLIKAVDFITKFTNPIEVSTKVSARVLESSGFKPPVPGTSAEDYVPSGGDIAAKQASENNADTVVKSAFDYALNNKLKNGWNYAINNKLNNGWNYAINNKLNNGLNNGWNNAGTLLKNAVDQKINTVTNVVEQKINTVTQKVDQGINTLKQGAQNFFKKW